MFDQHPRISITATATTDALINGNDGKTDGHIHEENGVEYMSFSLWVDGCTQEWIRSPRTPKPIYVMQTTIIFRYITLSFYMQVRAPTSRGNQSNPGDSNSGRRLFDHPEKMYINKSCQPKPDSSTFKYLFQNPDNFEVTLSSIRKLIPSKKVRKLKFSAHLPAS